MFIVPLPTKVFLPHTYPVFELERLQIIVILTANAVEEEIPNTEQTAVRDGKPIPSLSFTKVTNNMNSFCLVASPGIKHVFALGVSLEIP